MKVLHTSDWHLGQSLIGRDRIEEQAEMLDHLFTFIKEQNIEVLLVSGDIYNVKNPSNEAVKCYYSFLAKLSTTSCKSIILTAGNHDSASRLESGKEILKLLNIHVVGDGSDLESQLIPIKDEAGVIRMVVAAVPYLHNKDLPSLDFNLTGKARIENIRAGIVNHFDLISKLAAEKYPTCKVHIAMGHLFAKGASVIDKQDNIYLADLENITADQFPKLFNYVALGHIHKAQKIGKKEYIRYSGSLIPLSFSEHKHSKSVTTFDVLEDSIQNIQEHSLPILRMVKKIKGTQESIIASLHSLIDEVKNHPKKAFCALEVTEHINSATFNSTLDSILEKANIDILKLEVKPKEKGSTISNKELVSNLLNKGLDIQEVFDERCQLANIPEDSKPALKESYLEIVDLLKNEGAYEDM